METAKKAIILCAGEGKRLRPLTLSIPKCLVSVNGVPILVNAIRNFVSKGVQEVTLVVGHLYQVIEREIGQSCEGVKINYVVNDIYKDTNSMYSLYLGMKDVDEAVWIAEGDVFFGQEILNESVSGEISWFVDSGATQFDGAFLKSLQYPKVSELMIIKENIDKTGLYKSIGILHLNRVGLKNAKKWLTEAVDLGNTNVYYDLIFSKVFDEGIFNLVDIKNKEWYEIDTSEDLAKAEELFKNKL